MSFKEKLKDFVKKYHYTKEEVDAKIPENSTANLTLNYTNGTSETFEILIKDSEEE